ncbi:MAG: hypothetical protein JWM41_1438 [Gemmatimonadetes bacterium]|nr:hypothetical protein [Gemmatimonadota bacterium]
MRWTSSSGKSLKQTLARFGIKAAIVVSGVAVAAGTIHKQTYLPRTPLAKRIVASAPVNVKTPWGTTHAADSSVAPGGLDAGVDHDRISYWVKRLSTTLSADFARTLERKAKYSDMIAAKLEAKQMPRDLVYLAMIESEFNPNAKSPVKAVGLWQFMSATARQFGLTVKGRVDERRDPARATDAAVAYLSSLHDRLGSWYLAAAAYNSGEGTVLRALKATTGKTTGTDDDFFRILPLLPKETQDYVPKLIASARVGNDPARYGVAVKEAAASGDVAPTPAATVTPTPTATAATPVAKHVKKSPPKTTKHKVATAVKKKIAPKTRAKLKTAHRTPKP